MCWSFGAVGLEWYPCCRLKRSFTKNNTTNVVIQQNSSKLLMMNILMSETCWAHKKWNKIASDIKLVFYSSVITMMHGPTNISYTALLVFVSRTGHIYPYLTLPSYHCKLSMYKEPHFGLILMQLVTLTCMLHVLALHPNSLQINIAPPPP